MPGKRISTVSVLGLGCAALLGAADYSPLAVGNAWVYRLSQGGAIDTQTIEVGSAQIINGQERYNVIFLGRPVLLRASDDGTLIWSFDTNKEFTTVNGVKANGSTMDGPGATVSDGMLFVNSGYGGIAGRPGNVLLAFGVE